MDLATGRNELGGVPLPGAPPSASTGNGSSGGVSFGAALGINVGVSESIARINAGKALNAQDGSVTIRTSNDTDAGVEANASAVGTGSNIAGAVPLAAGATAPTVKGGLSLTFKDNVSTADTITRSSGSWAGDGFIVGDTIKVAGTTSNNTTTTFTIGALSADGKTLTLDAVDALTNETLSSDGVTIEESTDAQVKLTGTPGPTLSFKDNVGAPDTITLSSGSWATSGFVVGDTITVAGTASNDGDYKIGAIAADGLVLTLEAGNALSNETAAEGSQVAKSALGSLNGNPTLTFADNGVNDGTITRSAGSWVDDGFTVGDAISVSGTAKNNNTYTIAGISNGGTQVTLAGGYFVQNETTTASQTVGASLLARPKTAAMSGTPVLRFIDNGTAPDSIDRGAGSFVDEGFAVGDTITVAGTDNNNGSFSIAGMSADGKVLTLAKINKLTPEEFLSGGPTIQRATDTGGEGKPGVGIGIAAAINVATVTNKAVIAGDTRSTGLTVAAAMDKRDAVSSDPATPDSHKKHLLGATAISGAGSFGLAGSFAINVGVTKSEAYIARGTTIDAGSNGSRGDVTLTAENITNSTVLATAEDRE